MHFDAFGGGEKKGECNARKAVGLCSGRTIPRHVRHLTGSKHKVKDPVGCRTYCTHIGASVARIPRCNFTCQRSRLDTATPRLLSAFVNLEVFFVSLLYLCPRPLACKGRRQLEQFVCRSRLLCRGIFCVVLLCCMTDIII